MALVLRLFALVNCFCNNSINVYETVPRHLSGTLVGIKLIEKQCEKVLILKFLSQELCYYTKLNIFHLQITIATTKRIET